MNEKIISLNTYKKKKEEEIKEKNEIKIIEEIIEEKKEFKDKGYEELYDEYCDLGDLNFEIRENIVDKCKNQYMKETDRTLKKILWEVEIEEVLNVLEELFEYEDYQLEEYEKMYKDLKTREIEKKEDDISIVMTTFGDFIVIKNNKLVQNPERMKWDEWLNAKCSESALEQMSEAEWVARCFWNMTIISYDESGIIEKNEKYEQLIKEMNESKDKDRYTVKQLIWKTKWEDVKKELLNTYIVGVYEEESEVLEEYKEFYKKIIQIKEIESTEESRIMAHSNGEVYIYNLKEETVKELLEEYWEVTLGTKCSEVSFRELSEVELVTHIIAEMMFYTSDEEIHKENVKRREENIEE